MSDKNFVKDLADIDKDFSKWYTDIILKCNLADYSPVRGCMVIKPYGYAIWEQIQEYFDKRLKLLGVKNAYFPMFIPESFLLKEAEHVEGFAPEVAIVTKAGGEELTENLIVRPTSETIIGSMFSKWIKSYRDLPYKINQWCNVVRWEKTTRPFLRTSEFLWQEGHSVHLDEFDAKESTIQMFDEYIKLCKDLLAIPVLSGKKTEKEKFAGADETYSIEARMHDGKCLQSGTSHNLGQHFTKAFDIKYLSSEGIEKYAYSTSYGISTRLIGAIIMVHGDNRGLKLPPRVAPIQIMIIPIASHKPGVIEKCREIKEILLSNGFRVEIDESDNTPGFKFNECELQGIPLRLEIGPRDIENNLATAVRRDNLEKFTIGFDAIEQSVKLILDEIHNNMYNTALKQLNDSIIEVDNKKDLIKSVDNGKIALCHHCGEIDCEKALQEETSIKSRVIYDYDTSKPCAICGKKSKYRVYFGKQY